MKIAEDSVWRYYNCPDPKWSSKCRACREKVTSTRMPVQECVDCWKVEMWKRGTAFLGYGALDFDGLMDGIELLVEAGDRIALQVTSPVVAKAARAPIQVVRTGIPLIGYPSLAVDDLLVLYAQSIAERESLRDLVRDVLGLSDEAAALVPIRRGCWRFDPILGPWQGWHPVDSDWSSSTRGGPGL